MWDQWEKEDMGAFEGEAYLESATAQRIAWQHPRNRWTPKYWYLSVGLIFTDNYFLKFVLLLVNVCLRFRKKEAVRGRT